MEFAKEKDIHEIMSFYQNVIDTVNKTDIKLGWNIAVYPDVYFVRQAVEMGQMCILREKNRIVAAAVVNHTVNSEYDNIDWQVKEPKDRISTIHALAVAPDCRSTGISSQMLADIETYCKDQGDLAIHLDVIDTNVPAYKLYLRNGYREIDCIKMYYEVVGTREFWMMERIL